MLCSIIAEALSQWSACCKQPDTRLSLEQPCRSTVSIRMLPLFGQESFSSCSITCNFAAERPPVHVREGQFG